MELGSPPLYAEANRASRDMDLTCLKELGPFVHCLFYIAAVSETTKPQKDRIASGRNIPSSAKFNLGGAFLLWRGAPMKQEWIDPYIANIGTHWVKLPGTTSTSRNPLVALNFSLGTTKPDCTPVLFCILCQNYASPLGLLMNSSAYSAYPDEGEFLLAEGRNVCVLAVTPGYKISNAMEEMSGYNGKTLTIIYLLM